MFNELNAKHPAVIAIIEIPDTEIFYPIVQGEDNEFYLNHDKDGDYHPFGEVFLDFENKSDLTDANSVIYGHNIRSAKAIFNELLNYENQDYYEDHRDIKIHNKNGLSVYSIISVFKADPDDDYRKNVFNNENDFNSFLKEYNELSLVDSELIHGNKLLTLSTCFTNYDRMVIQAIKTR